MMLLQVPIKIPPGMPTAQAQALVAYLKSNPAAAKAAYEQAQMVMHNPAMAHAFANMMVRTGVLGVWTHQVVRSPCPILQEWWLCLVGGIHGDLFVVHLLPNFRRWYSVSEHVGVLWCPTTTRPSAVFC
jgi:hypothetical protein